MTYIRDVRGPKKAWVYEKYINKIKYRKRFYGKKDNKNLLKQAINYKFDFEKEYKHLLNIEKLKNFKFL